MFDEIKFRFKLWQLQRSLSTSDKFYKKKLVDARKGGADSDEIDRIRFEDSTDAQMIQDDIADLATRHLYRKAYKYLLPQPAHDEEGMWEISHVTGRRLLTDKGIAQLRSSIRKESRERSEHVWMWLAGLTGLLGALTGFLALLFR